MHTRAALLLCAILTACGVDIPTGPPPTHWSPRGYGVYIPAWIPEDRVDRICAEIDASGLPEGWHVEVMVPIFEHEARSSVGRGQCLSYRLCVRVGYGMLTGDELQLPALAHEVQHARREIPDD